MDMKLLSSCTVYFLMISLFSCTVQETSAQIQQSPCVQQLKPCLNYLDGNRDPPSSCCEPLKYVIKSEPECLCSLMSINGSNQAEKAGINLANAQQLPARCGEHINPLGCILGAPSSNSASFPLRIPSMIMAAASWMFCLLFFVF